MDECIERSEISRTLFAARASLRDPSRPYSPLVCARSLLQTNNPCDDYVRKKTTNKADQQRYDKVARTSHRLHAKAPLKVHSQNAKRAGGIYDDAKISKIDDQEELSIPSVNSLLQRVREMGIEFLTENSPGGASSSIDIIKLNSLLRSFIEESDLSHHRKNAEIVYSLRLQVCDLILGIVMANWENSTALELLAPHILVLLSSGCPTNNLLGADADRIKSYGRMENIVAVAKHLFDLSQNSQNDQIFVNASYLEAVLITTSSVCHAISKEFSGFLLESLTYFYATLKNISTSQEKMLPLLGTNGAIAVMGQALDWSTLSLWSTCNNNAVLCLVQITSILRNLASGKSYLKQFQHAMIAQRLCALLRACDESALELVTNITRILGKLTLHEKFRFQINEHGEQNLHVLCDVLLQSYRTLIQVPRQHDDEVHMLCNAANVRILFILGNLCAGNSINRNIIAFACNGISVLSNYLSWIMNEFESICIRSARKDNDEAFRCLEVFVKLTRLIANLCISPTVAQKFASEQSIDALYHVMRHEQSLSISAINTNIPTKSNSDHSIKEESAGYTSRIHTQREELILNVVSCITNLSYQPSLDSFAQQVHSTPKHWVQERRLEIASIFLDLICQPTDKEIVLEILRAFGNLTRLEGVLDLLLERNAMETFIQLLDPDEEESVQSICGVLINASLFLKSRSRLLRIKFTSKAEAQDSITILSFLKDLLVYCIDPTRELSQTSTLSSICKVLHNLICLTTTGIVRPEVDGDEEGRGIVKDFIKSDSGSDLVATVERVMEEYDCDVHLCSVAAHLRESIAV